MSTEQLEAWLNAAFPDQPGWAVRDHQSIHSFQQQMDRVRLEWPASGATAEVFVRVYRSYLSWWTLITPDLPEREYVAAKAAARGGVPVAPVLYHGSIDGAQGAVIERVQGETGVAPSAALVENLAETLARLHQAPVEASERAHLPDCSIEALLRRLAAWSDEIGASELRNELREVEKRLAAVDERPAALVHGDCHSNNILVDGEIVTALLDWEEAALGDPRIDVCWLANAIRHHDPALVGGFIRAYEDRAGYSLGDLQVWSDFMELRYLIVHAWIKHALAQGIQLPSANPEAWPD